MLVWPRYAGAWFIKRGDTLSEIALEHTGKASNYPQIFKASKSITQPGGHHLSDPDVIDIGWKLTIPGDAHQQGHGKSTDKQTANQAGKKTTSKAAELDPARSDTAAADPGKPAGVASDRDINSAASSALYDADAHLTASGDILTSRLGADGSGRRRCTVGRNAMGGTESTAGRPVPQPPPRPHYCGPGSRSGGGGEDGGSRRAPIAQLVMRIDEVLRRLAAHFLAHEAELPSLVGVDAARDALTLRFRRPIDLPDPFTAVDPQVWRVSAAADLEAVGPFSP